MDELELTPERQTTAGHSPEARDSQARKSALAAKRMADERRGAQSGLSGWVADRASGWTLDGPDWGFLEQQKYFWNPLMDYWFRMEVEG